MPTPATSLWTQDFPYFDFPHALTSGAGYLWIGNESSTGSFIRIDPTNRTAWVGAAFANDGKHGWCSDALYVASKDKVYFLMGTPNVPTGWTTVSEVDPVTLVSTDVIQTSTYNVEQGSFACDGTYLYIAPRMDPSNVYKYRISDWAYIGLCYTAVPYQHCCRIDGTKMYVTSSYQLNGYRSVVEIDLGSFTVTQNAVIDHDRVLTDDMAITANYLWLGSENTGNILRVSRSNLNDVTVISTGISARNFGLYYDGESIWTGWEGSPGIIGKLNPNTLALQTFQFSGANQSGPNEFLRIDNVMYFTHYHVNGTLTAMGVAGTSGGTSPGAFLAKDTITLTDAIALSAISPPGIFILDSINLVDQVTFSKVQNSPYSDTLTLSDSIRVHYDGDFGFSDSISLSDHVQVFDPKQTDSLYFLDSVAISLGSPQATRLGIAVADCVQIYDLLSLTFPNARILITDALLLQDDRKIIKNSLDTDYLRRYLNDMR